MHKEHLQGKVPTCSMTWGKNDNLGETDIHLHMQPKKRVKAPDPDIRRLSDPIYSNIPKNRTSCELSLIEYEANKLRLG